MSVKAMAWVLNHSQTQGNTRLVMLALADMANDEGISHITGWDSPHVERWTRLDSGQVEAAVREASGLGELRRGHPDHARHVQVLTFCALEELEEGE